MAPAYIEVGSHVLYLEVMQSIYGRQDWMDILQEVRNYDEI